MTLAVIELHDVTLRCGNGGRVIEAPGHALITAQGIVTGSAARARAWREPQHSFDQFWQQLGTAALPVASRHARHFADLAHAQLLALHQAAGSPAQVIFAVPGSLGRDQLAVLLGIAHAMPFAVAGLVDAALAATQGEIAERSNVLHLDLLRHCAVVSHLHRSGDELLRERVAVLPELGLNRLHERWARHIAERFIAAHRYDPLHTGGGEQALREALPGWLTALTQHAEVNALLAGPRGPLPLALSAVELIAVADPLYARLLHAAAARGDATRLLAASGAALPGLRERLGARPLAATASITGALAQREAIAARPANVLITRLPAAPPAATSAIPSRDTPTSASAQVSTTVSAQVSTTVSANVPTNVSAQASTTVSANVPTNVSANVPTNVSANAPADVPADVPANTPTTGPERACATHLLWRHRAHPIGAGLVLLNAAGEVRPCAGAEIPAGPRLESVEGRLLLRGASMAIALTGDAADLRAGDQLRIGDEVLELITVLGTAQAPA